MPSLTPVSLHHYSEAMLVKRAKTSPVMDTSRQLYSETVPVKRARTAPVDSPRQFFLNLLLGHRQSLWKTSLDGAIPNEWARSVEYFDLFCGLIHDMKCKCEYEDAWSIQHSCTLAFTG